MSRDQLQVYLDEFVFRHNRRNQPMAGFQTLLGLGTCHLPTAWDQIRAAKDVKKRVEDEAASDSNRDDQGRNWTGT